MVGAKKLVKSYLVLITSLRAMCIVTLPERIPLKIAIASECERPWVECPLTDKISSPKILKDGEPSLIFCI